MNRYTTFFDPACFKVISLVEAPDLFLLNIKSVAKTASCPLCRQPSKRVRSLYTRTISDLPIIAKRLKILLLVRRFYCDNTSCSRRIFCERVPKLASAYARCSCRLIHAHLNIALASGGESGALLARLLGMPSSPDTLLRRIRTATLPEMPEPLVIGVDDWSYRRGVKFGTIICDLENRTTLDLLPDRDSETLSRWLKAHKELAIISRDRAGEYSKAAREGAPQAAQVADRWHLLKNLGDSLKRLANRFNGQIRLAAQDSVKPSPSDAAPHQSRKGNGKVSQKPDLPMSANVRRQELYQKVHGLAAEQVSIREISRRLGIQRHTVRTYLRASECPRPARRVRSNSVQEFTGYLQERWKDGCHNAAALYREVRERGYSGHCHAVRRMVAKWRESGDPISFDFLAKPPSASMVARLLMLDEVNMTPEFERFTDRLLMINPLFEQARKLSQEFVDMIRNRLVERWSGWIRDATSEEAPSELRKFGESLMQDEQAVKQALSCDWSNGQVEGHVNRLKTIKRQMYGRGSFELLRRRVLLRISH